MNSNSINNKHGESLWVENPSQHRFNMPKGIYRVTAGQGGESFLIDAGSKVGLYDCGMAYCNHRLIENIESKLKELNKDSLNFVLVSHSHYDHIGALPYIIRRWPDVEVIGAEKLERVFSSDRAKETMKRLGGSAQEKYAETDEEKKDILVDGMRVDKVVSDGEEFQLGDLEIKAIWTPGHTDCSMSYYINPGKTLFISESLGVLENDDMLHTSILKSFRQTIDSAEKCKRLDVDNLICSHYGVVPENVKGKYFDMYVDFAERERDFIINLYNKGLNEDEILVEYEKEYWTDSRDSAQPKDAFMENAVHTIHCMINER